jgi:hypothetical protein
MNEQTMPGHRIGTTVTATLLLQYGPKLGPPLSSRLLPLVVVFCPKKQAQPINCRTYTKLNNSIHSSFFCNCEIYTSHGSCCPKYVTNVHPTVTCLTIVTFSERPGFFPLKTKNSKPRLIFPKASWSRLLDCNGW